MIVSRPEDGQRLVLDQGQLDPEEGLVGDNWRARGSRHTEDGSAHPDMQITLMNSRIIDLLAGDRARWPLAGDQLYVDLDLSPENLPAGQRLTIGDALMVITDMPHTGCAQFTERYGSDAIRFVNSPEGRAARRRGVYARVLKPGSITTGDRITKQD
jgi:MOSC domain-containing protein YiiM